MVKVSPDISGARKYLEQLQGRELPRIVGRTLARTAGAVRSQSSKILRQRVTLQKSTIDQAISTARSNEIQNLSMLTLGRAWFEVRFSGKPFPIRDFQARKIPRGVTFRVTRTMPRKLYLRKGQKGFIVERLGGHVFVRDGVDPPGKKKAPIRKAVGPSIPQFAATRRMQAALTEFAREYWARELERNVRFAISRRN